MLPRVLEPETLDHLAPDDPAAVRSRRDLRRVNRVMGAQRILGRAIDRVAPASGPKPLRIVELGCGDGLLMLDIARSDRPALKNAELTLLDMSPIVTPSTLASYADAGWRATTATTDVLAWADGDGERWDIVVANLFLHHFEGDAMRRLLAGCARRADALVACEPRRSRFALAASHLVVFLGANAVTRRDAVLSVRAGFVADELGRAWANATGHPAPCHPGRSEGSRADRRRDPSPAPRMTRGWQLDEYEDGPFTHCFCASRRAAST